MADNNTENLKTLDNLFTAIDTIIQKRIESLPYDKTIVATIEDASKASEGAYIVNDGVSTFMAYSDNTEYMQGQQVYINIPQGDFTKQRIIIGKYFPNDDNKFIYNYVSPMNSFVSITGNLISEIGNNSTWLIANGKTKYKCIWEGRVSLIGYDTLGISAGFRSWLNDYNDLVGGEYGIQIDIRSDQATSQQQEMPLFYTFYFSNKEMTGDPYNYDTFYPQEKIFDISGIKQIDAIRIGFYQNANFRSKSQGYLISAAEEIEQNANLFINNPIVSIGYNSNNFKEDQIILRTPSNEMYLTELTDTIKTKYPDTNNYTEDEIQQFIKDLNQKEINALWIHLLTEEEQTGIYNLTASGISATRTISIADLNDYEEPFNLFWYRYIFDENQKYEGVTWDPQAGEYWAELVNNRNNFSIIVDPDIKKPEEQYKAIIEYPAKEDVLLAAEEYLNQKDGLYDQRKLLIDTDIKIKNSNNENISYISSFNNEINQENSLHLIDMKIALLQIQHNCQIYFIVQNEILTEEEKGVLLQEEDEKYNIEYNDLINQKGAITQSLLNLITNEEIYNYFLNLLNLDVNDLLKEISIVINNLKTSITDDQQFNTEASNYIDTLEFKNQLKILQLYFPKYIGQYSSILIPGYSPNYLTQISSFFNSFRLNFSDDKIKDNACFTTSEEDINEKNALLFIYDIVSQISSIDYEIETYRNSQLGTIQYYSSTPIVFKNTDPNASLNAVKDALSNLEIVVDEEGFQGTYNLYEGDGHIQNEGEASELRVLEAKYEKYSSDSNPTENNEIITWRIPLHSTMIQPPEEGVEYELYEAVEKSTYDDLGTFISEKEVTRDNYKNSLYYYYDSDNDKYIQIISSSTIKKPDPNNTENLIDVENFYEDIGQFYKKNNTNVREENGYMIISRRGDPIQYFRIKPFCEASFTNNEIFCSVEKDLINLEASTTLSFSPVGNSGTDYTFYLEFYDNQNQFALQAMGFSQDDIDKEKHKLKVRARVFNEMHQEVTQQINEFKWELLGRSSSKKVTINDDVKTSENVIYSTIANLENDFHLDENNNPIEDENHNPIDYFADDFKNLIIKCQCNSDVILGEASSLMEIDDNGNIINIPLDANKTNITLTAYLSIPVIRKKGIIGGYIGSGLISYDNSGTNPFYYNGNFKVYDINFQNLNYIAPDPENNIVRNNYWSILGLDPGEEKFFPKITYEGSLSVPSIYLYDDKQVSISFTYNNNIEFILPLRLYKRIYASKVINSWDGSLTLNENDGIILSTMMGAGKKDNQNRFNGVLMGDMADEDEGNIYYTGTGLYGFNEGVKSFGFNINGVGFIGKASTAQILFNGNEGSITSASFGSADGGVYIDLNDGWIEVDGKGDNSANILINANLDNSNAYFKIASPTKNLIFIGNDNYFLQSNNFNGSEGSLANATQGCYLDLEDGTLIAVDAYLKGRLESDQVLQPILYESYSATQGETRPISVNLADLSPSQLQTYNNNSVAAENWLVSHRSQSISRDYNAIHKVKTVIDLEGISMTSQYQKASDNSYYVNNTFRIAPTSSRAYSYSSWEMIGKYFQGRTKTERQTQGLGFSGGDFIFYNKVYIFSDLEVSGGWNTVRSIILQGNVNVSNNVDIGGTTTIDGRLRVWDRATFEDDVFMTWLDENASMDSTSHYLYITKNGKVKIHTGSSQRKYKENIKVLNNIDISKLYDIPVYTFNYKKGFLSEEDERKDKNMPGFIVEDWEAIMPIAIDHNKNKNGESRNMWNSNIIIPLMFQMIKNDHEINQQLQKEIKELKEKIYEDK